MNKQEVIEKIEQEKYDFSKPWTSLDRSDYKDGYNDASDISIEFIEQLDEPQKVKVPEFVAEWIKWNKGRGGSVFILFDIDKASAFEERQNGKGLLDWMIDHRNHDLLIRAWLDGYEVEEPLWVIEYQEKYLNDIQFKKRLHNLIVEADGVWGSKNRAMRFTSEKQAERILFLCGGTVEKV